MLFVIVDTVLLPFSKHHNPSLDMRILCQISNFYFLHLRPAMYTETDDYILFYYLSIFSNTIILFLIVSTELYFTHFSSASIKGFLKNFQAF